MHITETSNAGAAASLPRRTMLLVLGLCWAAILSEGYDIGVMGTIVPALLSDPQWNLTPLEVGAMSSSALFGTLIGAYFISPWSDIIGRKPLIILCIALFSGSMLAAAWAPTPQIFSLVRGIGGLGLGGVIPVAAALTIEYSPPHRRNLNFALMYSGYPLGALLSAWVGMTFMPEHGWRAVVAAGAIALLLIPIMLLWLPESLEFLVAKKRTRRAQALAARLGISELPAPPIDKGKAQLSPFREILAEVFSKRNRRGTLCLWVAQCTAVMVVYGLGTWLPQYMRNNGYDLGSSLMFFAIFNLAAALGGIVIGRIADRFGARRTLALGFTFGACAIAALSMKNSIMVNYILVACAGFGSIAVALVQLGYIANYYAPHARASATGWAVGIGRFGAMGGPILGGFVAGLQLGSFWNFLVFAAAAIAAAIAIIMTPAPAHER